MRAWFRFVVVFVCFTPAVAAAHGISMPEQGITLGPSIAYAHHPTAASGVLYGLDAAYVRYIFWLGGGMRVFDTFREDDRALLPYVEGGLYLMLNMGVGYTFDTAERAEEISGAHLFLGLPLPVAFSETNQSLYFIETYYRATYADPGTLHEVGMLFKWSAWWELQRHSGDAQRRP